MSTQDKKLREIAAKVMKKANIPEEETFGSILIILAVISISLTLIRILQECNNNKLPKDCAAQDKYTLYAEEIKGYSMRKGWFTKLRIKRAIKKELSSAGYEKYGFALTGAFLDQGQDLNNDEVATLVEASNV